MMIMFPLTFLSNAFVPTDTMPDWLQAFVQINPVSQVVSAVRDLDERRRSHRAGRLGVLGCVAIVAVFAPLAVRSYRRAM